MLITHNLITKNRENENSTAGGADNHIFQKEHPRANNRTALETSLSAND